MNLNSTRKTTTTTTAPATFRATKRSHSMKPPSTTSLPPLARTLSTTMEFPTTNTSSQQAEEESSNNSIVHYSHSQHRLSHVTSLDPFTCSGCKEKGAGKRFSCQRCDFQLHEFCALSPPALKTHPLHSQHQLKLHPKPKPGGILWPRCDVCGKGTKGFTFRCGACNFQMHPCCAMLSNEMNFSPVHPHSLKLYPHHQYPTTTTSTSSGAGGAETSVMCGECKRKRSGRVYRCTICDYHLHAVCAKNMINGLKANGVDLSSDKPSMLGPAARIASQVVIEFIGGLFEGFGEAVGQALLQNIARSGRDNSRTRRSSIDRTNKEMHARERTID